MNLSASRIIGNRILVHRWVGRVLALTGFGIALSMKRFDPIWECWLAIILLGFGVLNMAVASFLSEKEKPSTEKHRERVLNGLDGLQEAREALDAITYDHPNVHRARLHVAKAIECLERRERRLRREQKLRPLNPAAASEPVGGEHAEHLGK